MKDESMNWDKQADWCEKQAVEHGESAADLLRALDMISDDGVAAAVEWAREAVHFASAALGYRYMNGKSAVILDARVAPQEIRWDKQVAHLD